MSINKNNQTAPQAQPQYKYIMLLIILYMLAQTATILLVYRTATIGIFIIPSGVFIYPLTCILADIVAEVYGSKTAKKMVWLGVISSLVLSLILVAIARLPSPNIPREIHLDFMYKIILDDFFLGNLSFSLALLTSGFVNIYFISKWRILLKGKYFWLRSIGSSLIGEAAMIIVLAIAAWSFGGTLTFRQLIWLILAEYTFKTIYACVVAYPGNLVANYLKRKENFKLQESAVYFNPFK